jgi:hypothetical protein
MQLLIDDLKTATRSGRVVSGQQCVLEILGFAVFWTREG